MAWISLLLYFISYLITQSTCVDSPQGHIEHFPSFDGIFNDVKEASDFDVVHPLRLDASGRFLTHDVHYVSKRRGTKKTHLRKRRHIHERSPQSTARLLYSIPRGDHILTLNLTENLLLIPEEFVTERIKTINKTNGDLFSSSISKTNRWPCHFRGHVEGQKNSRVALSTCNGLTGLLITEEGEFFIEPIKDPTHFQASTNADPRSQAHKIYRRDLSSILDKAEPMLHYEKLVNNDKLARLKHIKIQPSSSSNSHDPNTINPSQMNNWYSLYDDPHKKEFCGVLDTKRRYRRIIRKREQWEAKRESASSGNGQQSSVSSSEKSRRRSRRSVSVKRMVEMLVAVDKKMIEHYEANENGGVQRYVLTIINMVSEIFRDASIGNSLEISLVRLVLLEDEKKGPKITRDAENTLDNFCRWAKKVNPKDDSHPNHHDVAVLLTRQEICSQSNKSCETLGLAHVAGMCQSHRSCNVNQDTGLSVAYTVAHELGHNFAMHHDGQLNDCRPSPKYNHVMAPHITSSSLPMVWSSCSRKYITRFLDRNWGFCLNDQPAEQDEFTPPTVLPGVIYDADHQCRLMFGEKSKYCPGIDDICHRLWCYHGGTCRSRLHAAAPGTKCGKTKWCYDGKCISMSKEVKVIDGGWGTWSAWSSCSRTCGIGVSSSIRYCENPLPQNGGEYCVGERKRYKTCSKWRCRKGAGSMTFREQQCASFNNVKYKNMTFSWKPVESALYPCELHCYTRAGKIPFADRLRDKVIDGTKCFPGSDDICVDGICRRVGCDKNIGSRALEDRCGECHGNGSTCYKVSKTFSRKKGEEYTPIALLPLGARNVEISEVAPVINFLALRHATNKSQYYLNGNYMIQWDTKFQLAGTQFTYRRINQTVDRISAPGPLTEEIMVVILFVEENPGVSIEYTKPYVVNLNKSEEEEFPEFKWKIQDWSECTQECGKGYQIMSTVCEEKKAGVVDDFFCNDIERPKFKKRSCNDILCPPRWSSSPWEDCSITCGSKSGIQRRLVMCVRSVGDGDEIALNHTLCSEMDRPTNKRRCRLKTEIPCPVWRSGDWERCSETCGGGVKNRTVECVTYVMNEVINLENVDDEADLMDIEEIDIQDIDMTGDATLNKRKQPEKNSEEVLDSSEYDKHEILMRAKGLLSSIEMDSLMHEIDLDGYDVEKNELCDSSKKPLTQKACNSDACPTTTSPIVETSVGLDWATFSQFINTSSEDEFDVIAPTKHGSSFDTVNIANDEQKIATTSLSPSTSNIMERSYNNKIPDGIINNSTKIEGQRSSEILNIGEIPISEPIEVSVDYTVTITNNEDTFQDFYDDSNLPTKSTDAAEDNSTKEKSSERNKNEDSKYDETFVRTLDKMDDREKQANFNKQENETDLVHYNSSENKDNRQLLNFSDANSIPTQEIMKTNSTGTEIVVPDIVKDNGKKEFNSTDKNAPTQKENGVVDKDTEVITESTNSHFTTTSKSLMTSNPITTFSTSTTEQNVARKVKSTTTSIPTTKLTTTTYKLSTDLSSTTKPTTVSNPITTTSVHTTTSKSMTTSKQTTTGSVNIETRSQLVSSTVTPEMFGSRRKSQEMKSIHKQQQRNSGHFKDKEIEPYFDVIDETDTRQKIQLKTDDKNDTPGTIANEEDLVMVPDLRNVDLDFDVKVYPNENTRKVLTTTISTTTEKMKELKTTTSVSLPATIDKQTSTISTTTTEKPTTTSLIKAEWIAGKWSECSTTCGVGAKIRQVECSVSNEKLCNETDRPPPAVLCNLKPCAKWVYGHWTKCSALCGAGTRTKKIECVDLFTKKPLHPHHCRSLPPLTSVKISCIQSKCMPWKTSRWSSCSKPCGSGVQLRRVACSRYDQCDPALKPNQKKSCFVKKCVQWRPLIWNKCSVHCGGGLQRRQVICIEQANGIQTNSSECSPGLRPNSVRKCNQGQCPVTDYDFSSCHNDRLSPSFCKLLESLGRCVQPSLAIQCCVTCKTFLSVRSKDKIS
ncbi:A disintegrin and metalloproteinase with thrombospondin motifs 7-like isoform X1 [Styela clava]